MTRTKLSITVSSVIAAMTLVGCSGNVQSVEVNTKKNNTSTTENQTPPAIITAAIQTPDIKVEPQRKIVKAPSREETWRQIYHGFRIPNHNREPRVQQVLNQFSRHPKHLSKMAERANPYLPYIVNEIKKRGMPSEIALLPFVESAFKPNAYSHAAAAGLWQFIPETGRRYGLKKTATFDGRYDPFLATHAALGYLQDLSKRFHGDWLLALAAYNCGENRVEREVAKNKASGRPTDFWHLDLPKETKQYVPRLLAYKELYRQPARYRINLPERNPRSEPLRITVTKAIDLRQVARHAGLPANTLSRLNLAYKTGIATPQHQKGAVNFPRPYANKLLKIIHDIPELPESVVQQANRKAIVVASVAKTKKIRKTTRKKARKKSLRAKKTRIKVVTHRVRRGDTLAHIAKRYGVSVHRIMRMNKMRSTRLKAGKRLKVTTKKVRSRRG